MKASKIIQQEVMAALDAEASLDIADLGVSVHNGVVTLNGRVDSYSKKITAQQAVWRVTGVRALADQIAVALHQDEKLSDAIIAESILRTLDRLGIVTGKIRLKVEDGKAMLEGNLDSDAEKQAIIMGVWYLPYVKDIIDMLEVKVAAVEMSPVGVPGVKQRKIVRGPWFANYEDEVDPPTRQQSLFFHFKTIKHLLMA